MYLIGYWWNLVIRVFDIRAIDQKKDVQTGMVDVAISAKPSDTGGLREVVSVAVGAQVMVTVNIDVSEALANEVCGTIVNIDHTNNTVHAILVEFDSDRVEKEAIINSQYRWDFPRAVPIKRHDVLDVDDVLLKPSVGSSFWRLHGAAPYIKFKARQWTKSKSLSPWRGEETSCPGKHTSHSAVSDLCRDYFSWGSTKVRSASIMQSLWKWNDCENDRCNWRLHRQSQWGQMSKSTSSTFAPTENI